MSALHAVYHDRRDFQQHFADSNLLRSCFEIINAPYSEGLALCRAVNNSHIHINTLEITNSRDRYDRVGNIGDNINPNKADTEQRTAKVPAQMEGNLEQKPSSIVAQKRLIHGINKICMGKVKGGVGLNQEGMERMDQD